MKSDLGNYRNSKLLLEIAAVIIVKLSIIFALWYFFFSPSHRPDVSPSVMSDNFLGQHTTADNSQK